LAQIISQKEQPTGFANAIADQLKGLLLKTLNVVHRTRVVALTKN